MSGFNISFTAMTGLVHDNQELHAEHNSRLYSELHSGLRLSAILGAIVSTFLDVILGTNLTLFAEAQLFLDLFQTQHHFLSYSQF